ncbi:RNA-directed DNA polymerase, eukaryota, reverse transcriptase zinc-binding domain protein [Tanacetum coccineum]|uniref:RNA-directed DNA polymerase, eukaryota, reverse transcriptase zinc-binding domain protein n=1 Tax=Tanacetum coccineum TaxID=301880 RepID=A0ABQ5GT70_9ASTR
MYNGKSRHLCDRHIMIRQLIMNEVISIEFVRSQQNLADHLTKGHSFTWMNKVCTKMSKLDPFLVSNLVMDILLDLKVITLPHGWSDHIPLMLHDENIDYGPIPFKFFHSWLQKYEIFEAHDALVNLAIVTPQVHLDVQERDALEDSVSNEEIKTCAWDCSSQKASGLDGFTFLFFKSYWGLFKADVEAVGKDSFDFFVVMPKGAVSSFITLISKVANSINIKDFRPIFLIGLNIALKDVVGSCLINGTTMGNTNLNIPHIFYANDVVIVTEWNRIGVSSKETEDMAHETGCASGALPFIYLGLPIGSYMNLIVN